MTKRHLRRGISTAVVMACLLPLAACSGDDGSDAGTLKIGFVVDPSWAQVPVADAGGYFEEEGVEVEVINFSTGVEALQAVQGGQVDVATAADVPSSSALPASSDLRVVADGSIWLGSKVIARKDSGIVTATDLTDSKLGTPIGTSAEYFATTVLEGAGAETELVNVAPSSMVTSMSRGDVDAVSIFQPYQEQVITELGDDAVEIEAEGDVYRQHSLYLASSETLDEKQESFERFFRALDQAGEDLKNGDEDAVEAVAEVTQLDTEILTNVLAEFDFTLRLEDDLADILATLSVWAKESGKLPESVGADTYAASLDGSALPG